MSYKVYAGTQTGIDTWSLKTCIYDPGADDDTRILLDPVLTREGGKSGSFEATIPLGNVAHSALQKLKTIVEVEQDGEVLWQGRVMSHEMSFLLRQKIYCEGELAYLNDSALPPYQYQNITIAEFLSKVLSFHDDQVESYKAFMIGNVDVGESSLQILRATGCTMTDNKDKDEDGTHHSYDFSDAYGTYLITSPSNPESWKVDSTHIISSTYMDTSGTYPTQATRSYVVTKNGTNSYSVILPLCRKDTAFYKTTTSEVSSSISQDTETGKRVVHAASSTVDSGYQYIDGKIYKITTMADSTSGSSAPSVPAIKSENVSDHYDLLKETPLHDFGDGKNFGVTWDILQSELTDVYGGYFMTRRSKITLLGQTVTIRRLDYLSASGITEKNPQAIEFGKNLLDLDSYVKAENIVTRVIAVGYKTKGWWVWKSTSTIQAQADDVAAQKVYGIIQRVIVVEGTSSTTASLKKAAEQELAKNLRMIDGITVNAVDLKDAGVDVDRIQLMKKTHVLSKPHGLDTWDMLCTKIVEPLDKPDKKEFTIGTSFSSISDLQALSSARASTAFDLALSSARSLKQEGA